MGRAPDYEKKEGFLTQGAERDDSDINQRGALCLDHRLGGVYVRHRGVSPVPVYPFGQASESEEGSEGTPEPIRHPGIRTEQAV